MEAWKSCSDKVTRMDVRSVGNGLNRCGK
jgi:hypothetical protein